MQAAAAGTSQARPPPPPKTQNTNLMPLPLREHHPRLVNLSTYTEPADTALQHAPYLQESIVLDGFLCLSSSSSSRQR
jgi:hypothetical protein